VARNAKTRCDLNNAKAIMSNCSDCLVPLFHDTELRSHEQEGQPSADMTVKGQATIGKASTGYDS
jgi:hypothetical protein